MNAAEPTIARHDVPTTMPKPHEEGAASKAQGYTPIVEKYEWPIKRVPVWNAGKRATYSPPKEEGFRVRARVLREKRKAVTP